MILVAIYLIMNQSKKIHPLEAAQWVGIGVLIIGGVMFIKWTYEKFFKKFKPRNIPLPTEGKGIPMYNDGTIWSPLKSIELLYSAMHGDTSGQWWNPLGWGTDEEMIFMVLGDKTQDQLAAILNAYEKRYKRDMIADLKAELSGAELVRTLDYFAFIQE